MRRATQESTKGGDCRQCSPVELLQTAFFPPQIIPCGKSFRQGDILWKVHVDSDNISCGKSPLEKGKKVN